MRPSVAIEETHIVHENPEVLFPDGSSQKCECATVAVFVDGGTSWHDVQQEESLVIPEDCEHQIPWMSFHGISS
jgi:hypothetical protein